MRRWKGFAPAERLMCEWYHQATMKQRYPGSACRNEATRTLDDTIPALHMCAPHADAYIERRKPTKVNVGRFL